MTDDVNDLDAELKAMEAKVAEMRAAKAAKEEATRAQKVKELTDTAKELLASFPADTVKAAHKDLIALLLPFAPTAATGAARSPTAKVHPTPVSGETYTQAGDKPEYRLHCLGAAAFKVSRIDGTDMHASLPDKYKGSFSSVSAAAEAATADKRLRGTWIVDEAGTWIDTAGAGSAGKPPSVNGWAFWAVK